MFRVPWYRFRATLRSRWSSYLALVLLIGLVGGVAMGAVAAARRTQSSFPAFLKSTNPSDLTVIDVNSNDPRVHNTIVHLPHVKRVGSIFDTNAYLVNPKGNATADPFEAGVLPAATQDGLYFNVDRVTVTQGRMANPNRRDEFVTSALGAHLLHLHVGNVAHFGLFTNEQVQNSGELPQGKAALQITERLVGIVVFNNAVVQDDIDRVPTFIVFTPALVRVAERTLGAPGTLINALQLDHGARDVAAVEAEVKRAVPDASVLSITSVRQAAAERAIEPESIALGVFGGIAALAALLIAALVIGRQLQFRDQELETMRALGADPRMTSVDALIGIFGAIVVGSMLAVAVALALSPLGPLGPVRAVNPSPGVAFDGMVLGGGALVLTFGLVAIAWALAVRRAPHRRARRARQAIARRSVVATAAAGSGLSTPAVTGIRFALEPGSGRSAVPVRSAIVGTALAIVVVIATVIFGASLDTLVSHPNLYGWNWTYELRAGYSGISNIPAKHTTQLLHQDPDVAAWTGVIFDTFRIDGTTVPILGEPPNSPVAPPILSGHALRTRHQIVLGANTLADLHKHVGDTVEVNTGTSKPTRLVVVGTATLPAIGAATSLHMEIGTGAVLSDALIPTSDRGFGRHDGPEAFFVRFRSGANPSAASRTMQRIAKAVSTEADGTPSVLSVQRPAEIVNYGALGTTPTMLGAGLAGGAVIALGLTLIASVRRRRRDLALLKTLGFTRRQLAAAVAWQSTVAVSIGVVVGVPVGIALGRWLWDLFARQVHVVPMSSVPTTTVVLIAAGALVLANIVAAIPARQAARTRTAVLLRAE